MDNAAGPNAKATPSHRPATARYAKRPQAAYDDHPMVDPFPFLSGSVPTLNVRFWKMGLHR